ncbi:MAG TPA: hypothetical protein VJ779_08275 [Acetobacteraceae bacterium]|nr:hypothetical protein [Acetobacteraceae bacterium]
MSATTSLPPASGGARQGDVSPEEFLRHMSAMQHQYRTVSPSGAASVNLYHLPAHLTVAAAPATTNTGAATLVSNAAATRIPVAFGTLVAAGTPAQAAQSIAEVMHEQHQRTLSFIAVHRDAMMQALAAAGQPNSTQAFVQQMNAQRNRVKAAHEAQIDAMFARLTAIGAAHPAARPVILHTGNKVGGFVAGIGAEAAHVASTVKSAVAAGGSAVAKAAETVGHWASGAAKSVGHFFGGLF